MAKQSVRHPKLLRAIALGDGQRDIDFLAGCLGVSAKTIRRDIDALRKVGLAVEERTAEHGRKTYFLNPAAIPLKFTYDEAFALLWCCESAKVLNGTSLGESTEVALEKIRAALGPVEKRYLERMIA